MDTLYISKDIPVDFKYAKFSSSNYIDLYNSQYLNNNQTYNFYRIYFYDNFFCYDYLSTNNYYSQTLTEINVSQNVMYRRDMPQIFVMLFVFCFFFIFCLNIITSFVKRGGVLSDLL